MPVSPPLKNNCIEHFGGGDPMPGTSQVNCSIDDDSCKDWNNCGDCNSRRCNTNLGKCYMPGTGGHDCKYDVNCENAYRCNNNYRCTTGNKGK